MRKESVFINRSFFLKFSNVFIFFHYIKNNLSNIPHFIRVIHYTRTHYYYWYTLIYKFVLLFIGVSNLYNTVKMLPALNKMNTELDV